jgi:hypothetical protein
MWHFSTAQSQHGPVEIGGRGGRVAAAAMAVAPATAPLFAFV